jgi:hypothetical protein
MFMLILDCARPGGTEPEGAGCQWQRFSAGGACHPAVRDGWPPLWAGCPDYHLHYQTVCIVSLLNIYLIIMKHFPFEKVDFDVDGSYFAKPAKPENG